MKTFLKTATAMFLSLVLLAACENDEEDATGHNVPDTDDDTDDTTEANDENGTDEDQEETEEVSNDPNTNDDDTTEDYHNEEDDIDTPEPGIYEPEEVSGRDEPDQDGNVVYPQALENLELPYIYENTVVYNGTINPEQTIRVELPMENQDDSRSVDPYVTEDGNFSLSMGSSELEAGDEIIVYVMGDMPHEQQFRLPIEPEEEGMEIVESEADTSNIETNIKEETSVSELDPDEGTYQVKTVGDAEHVYYGFDDDPVTKERQLEHISGSTYQAYFNDLEPGQTVYFYIIASGVTTTIEEQVPEAPDN